jgi:hypothetical protein
MRRDAWTRLASLLLAIVAGACVAAGRLGPGGAALLLAGLCARLPQPPASEHETFVRSVLDRFAEVAILLGFVVGLRDISYGSLGAAAAMSGCLLVSDAGTRGERLLFAAVACFVEPLFGAHAGTPAGRGAQAMLGLLALTTFSRAAHRTLRTKRRLRSSPIARTLWVPAASRSPLP